MAPPNVAEIDPANSGKMFSAKDIPEIVKLFREADADGGGGLDIEEFCVAMKKLYGFVDKEKLTALHMQIDTNCDKTVDLGELMDFLLKKNKAEKDYDLVDSADQTRIYQKGQYISISSDGVLKFWTDRFELTHSFPLYKTKEALPYSHEKKMHVNDMVHIRELSHVAVATNEKELLFYNCSNYPDLCELFYSLKVEEIVTHMNYWFSNAKGAFSFVDIKGYLYVFISYRIQANGLFYRKANEKMSKRGCLTINVSSLLKNPSPEFFCFKVHVLNGMCRQIQYFKSLESFAICNSSSTRMVLVTHPKSNTPTVSKKVFGGRGDYEYFNCAEYSHSAGQLLTGGADGLLRVWFPYKNVSYEHVLKGHVRPITHIMFNPNEKTLISLSDDLNVCVWSEDGWMCRQNIQAYGMERAPISSVFYNIYNNELVFANSDIATCLGRGTDLFKKMLTSHDKPLCSLLYHDIFKQVVSVCKNGVVTVWDIVTGKAVMQFKVTPKQHVGFTAISFDGPQRRLITISKDGKVRLWNFNNGTELSVLPHNVPKKVTGIICINNRMFVSGRHSNIIFNLDMDKIDHRFLEHDFLNDIISMDVHDGLLVTAASNGNVVCWDAETGDALYWFNVSMSPRTQMVTKIAEGRTGRLSKKQPFMDNGRGKKPAAHDGKGRKGPLLLCLKTREDNIDTATVLTAEGSYIYAWSISSKGGVLGKFRAVKEEDAFVTTMSTDASEQILLTGDSKGMIYLWDIEEFGFKNQADTAPFEEIQGWHVPLSHLTGVVSVKCDPTCENILTAGLDCNVWLWTNTGSCKGLFGRDQWDLTQALPEETSDQEPAEKTGEAKKAKVRKKPFIKPIPIPPPSPTASLPDFTDLYESIKEAIRPRKLGMLYVLKEVSPPIRNALVLLMRSEMSSKFRCH
uniref:WD repeat-containing protein on Y chromosome n=1 Tax=Anabas testudineus TaxID=64144 RepID=A0A7N6BF24_ANATE